MPADGPQPPPASAVRLLGVLRWLLPLALCVIAVGVEWAEHVAEAEPVTPYFAAEVLIFSVVGPVAVWFTLSWVARLVAAYQATAAPLEEVNRDLETMRRRADQPSPGGDGAAGDRQPRSWSTRTSSCASSTA